MKDMVLRHLLRINRMRMRRLRMVLAPYGYGGTMHLILLYVGAHPMASQEEICSYYALDKASVARDARKLEEMEHIRRSQNPENRRQYTLELTEKGREMREVLETCHREYDRELSEGIPAEDWETLEALLEKVEENSCRVLQEKKA